MPGRGQFDPTALLEPMPGVTFGCLRAACGRRDPPPASTRGSVARRRFSLLIPSASQAMRSSAWLLVVLALLARSAKAQAGGDRDLLASLANAEICPAGAHCLPFQTSRQVHRSQGDAGTVMLPVGAMSNVYLRVPPAASLDLEFASSDSSLAVTAGTDADERVLLRDGSLVEEGRRVTLDLGPWGGTSSGYASGPRRAARVPHPAPASDGSCCTTEARWGHRRPPSSRSVRVPTSSHI